MNELCYSGSDAQFGRFLARLRLKRSRLKPAWSNCCSGCDCNGAVGHPPNRKARRSFGLPKAYTEPSLARSKLRAQTNMYHFHYGLSCIRTLRLQTRYRQSCRQARKRLHLCMSTHMYNQANHVGPVRPRRLRGIKFHYYYELAFPARCAAGEHVAAQYAESAACERARIACA
eukprot:6199684-Pleurochrysis_carterae.AAC.2